MNDLTISQLNDFMFCPASIFYHQLYGALSTDLYHKDIQRLGTIAHQSVDKQNYSTKKTILQSTDIYTDKYKLNGKIDIFDIEKCELIERKNKIVKIYDGYIFQLYAQLYSLREMGYTVNKLSLYSYSDNKKYNVLLPEDDREMLNKFEDLMNSIKTFSLDTFRGDNEQKCRKCIYNNICGSSIYDE